MAGPLTPHPTLPPTMDTRRLLLATGGTDTRVHLHVRPPRGSFQPALQLAGHENWLRSLAFRHVWAPAGGGGGEGGRAGAARGRQVLLASASQDRCAACACVRACVCGPACVLNST